MLKKIFATAAVLSAAVTSSAFAAGNIEAGKVAAQKYNCASCHGADYNTPIDPSYPKLAGQYADYLEAALVAYKRGGDSTYGRTNAIMAAQAKPMSRQEIQDVSAYLNSLPGALYLRK